jgi:hypothetical protein
MKLNGLFILSLIEFVCSMTQDFGGFETNGYYPNMQKMQYPMYMYYPMQGGVPPMPFPQPMMMPTNSNPNNPQIDPNIQQIDPDVSYDITFGPKDIKNNKIFIQNPNEIMNQLTKSVNSIGSKNAQQTSPSETDGISKLLDEDSNERNAYINKMFNYDGIKQASNSIKEVIKSEKDMINEIMRKSKEMDTIPETSNYGPIGGNNMPNNIHPIGLPIPEIPEIVQINTTSESKTNNNDNTEMKSMANVDQSKMYDSIMDLVKEQENIGLPKSKISETKSVKNIDYHLPSIQVPLDIVKKNTTPTPGGQKQQQGGKNNPDEQLFKNFLATFK